MKLLPDNALVSNSKLRAGFEKLLPYIKKLNKIAENKSYDESESSINLPFDESLLNRVKTTADNVSSKSLKYIIDVGIGGSSLGTKAVYDALYGNFDILEPQRFPKIIFLDTNDTAFIYKLLALLKQITNPEEVVINVISKSGTTTETIANLELLESSFPNTNARLVVTTAEDSELWKASEEMGINNLLPIPQNVGGRFSVFSPVSLFPLMLLELDILELLKGAMNQRKAGLMENQNENLPAISAICTFENYQTGKIINDTFVFHPELESLGKWYRQLLAESLGKQGKGLTPTVSLGSSDLHSVGQLYLGGPRDKFFTFVNARPQEDVNITGNVQFSGGSLENKSAEDVMNSIYSGVKKTFVEEKIPFLELELADTKEVGLGEFLQFKMLEVMFLGKLMDINTFDQPDVEGYKTKTKEILSNLK